MKKRILMILVTDIILLVSSLSGQVVITEPGTIVDGHIAYGNGQSIGIHVKADNVTLKNCKIENFKQGILIEADGVTIFDSIIKDNLGDEIIVYGNGGTIYNNTINNSRTGIGLSLIGNTNKVFLNNINTEYIGIYLYNSGSNIFSGNKVVAGICGVALANSDGNEFSNNEVYSGSSPDHYGMHFFNSHNNYGSGNVVIGNPAFHYEENCSGNTISITGVGEEFMFNGFILHQNYPNPFNAITNISYSLSAQSNVKLTVYNMNGQQMAVLIDGQQNAGNCQIQFNANNLPSGIYLVHLETYRDVKMIKMTLQK